MDFEKEYTIKEFAELRGVSQQAIYKQLDGKLKPFLVVRNGQKYISGECLRQLLPQTEGSTSQPRFNNHSTEVQQQVEMVENYREMLEVLREQLREKDKQISTLQEQLNNQLLELEKKNSFIQEQADRMATLFENSQKIEAGKMLLEQAKSEEESTIEAEKEPQEKKKPGIFSRIFQHR